MYISTNQWSCSQQRIEVKGHYKNVVEDQREKSEY